MWSVNISRELQHHSEVDRIAATYDSAYTTALFEENRIYLRRSEYYLVLNILHITKVMERFQKMFLYLINYHTTQTRLDGKKNHLRTNERKVS